MANILTGAPVVQRIREDTIRRVDVLAEHDIYPKLEIIKVGESADNNAYISNIKKYFSTVGVDVSCITMQEDVKQSAFLDVLESLNRDRHVHGIIVVGNLSNTLQILTQSYLNPDKDVDGMSYHAMINVYGNVSKTYIPCTAQAVVETLHYYKVPVEGKHVAVVGRSNIIGKPVSMMLMNEDATVTMCHSKTQNMSSITKEADIVVLATGNTRGFGNEYFNSAQTVIDVGIGFDEELNKLCGDAVYETVEPMVENITPVPGGIGSVTTAVLAEHVVESAMMIG